MKTKGRKRGFTLVEVVMVIVILGIIGGISVLSISRFYELWLTSTYKMEALWGSRYLLRELAYNIRQIRNKASVITANDTTLEFDMIYPDTGAVQRIAYQYLDNELLKNSSPIMAEVTDFAFSYYDSALNSVVPTVGATSNIRYVGMEFTLTSSGESIVERTLVKCRNLND